MSENSFEQLKVRLSLAREAQKAADTAVGLVGVLVASLKNLGLDVDLSVSDADQAASKVVVSFSVCTGVVAIAPPAAPPIPVPEPAPEPEPVAAAARPTPAPALKAKPVPARPKAKKIAGNPRMWSRKEISTALKMRDAGATAREISDKLGRPFEGTKFKLGQLKREAAENLKQPPAAQPARAPVPPAAPPVADTLPPNPERETGNGQGTLTGASDVTLAERRVETRLNFLTAPDGWDQQMDLEMVQLIDGGSRANDVAIILEVSASAVTSRFKDICPEPTIANREILLGVLRRRIKEERA